MLKKNLGLVFILVISSFFLLYRLDVMFSADSHFWYQRTDSFMKALQKGDFAATFQNPKPGVTVMWLSGLSLEAFMTMYKDLHGFRPFFYTYETFPLVDTVAKLPLVLLALASQAALYFFIKKLFDQKTALLTLILLVLQPYYVGVSRLFHGDGTLTVFMTLSSFALIYFLETHSQKILVAAGVFGGLAFLTKSQAVFLLPFAALALLIDFLYEKGPILERVKAFLVFLASYTGAVFIFFPAMWVSPLVTITAIFKEGFEVAGSGVNRAAQDFLFYPKHLGLMFTVATLVAFVLGLIKNFKQKTPLLILSYIFFYFLQMTLVTDKSLRYLLPLFPHVAVIGALGLNKLSKPAIIILAAACIFYLATFVPHYMAMSELTAWGSLGNEAAEYLNQKPKAADLKVVVTNKPQTIRPYFKGKTFSAGEKLPNGWSADYAIEAVGYFLPESYSYCVHEQDVSFKNRVFWRVYRCK